MNSSTRTGIANAFSCIAQHAIHGTWYTWRVRYPFIIENAATRLAGPRLAAIRANREKSGEGERDPGAVPTFYLPTYPCYVYLIGSGRT